MLDDFLIGLIDAAKAAGEVPAELDSKRAAYFIWGAVSSLPDWYRRSGPDSPQQIAWNYAALALKLVLRADAEQLPARPDEATELAMLNALIHR
jgi:hypothetical protein